jgi:hypothetical protein
MPHVKPVAADGEKLPSVTQTLNVLNKPPLVPWAFIQGQLYERGEISGLYDKRDKAGDAGTLAHAMIEHHLKGLPEPSNDGIDTATLDKAEGCFIAYLEWERSHKFTYVESELTLVSEKHRFGGTLDIGAVVGDLAIVDIKTSKGVYFTMKCQVAAYKELWNENYPDRPVQSCHILQLSPDGGFAHHYYPNLSAEWEVFLHALAVHKILKATGQRL